MPVAGGLLVASIGATLVDVAWAPAINTALIVILALVQGKEARKRRNLQHDIRDAKRKAGANRRSDGYNDTGARRRWDD